MLKSQLIGLKWLFYKIGVLTTLIIIFEILLKKPREHIVKFSFCGKNIEMNIVSERTDLAMLTEVFCFEAYEIKKNINPKLIVDGGANKGASAIYFGIKYPNAKIHCYEPNKNLIKVLKENLNINSINAEVYEMALSDKDGAMFFEKNENHQYSKLTVTNTGLSVKTVKLGSVYSGQHIDILKLDIEGSEEKVLNSIENKLEITMIIQEIHYDKVNFDNILKKLKNLNYYIEKPYQQYKILNSKVQYPILLANKIK